MNRALWIGTGLLASLVFIVPLGRGAEPGSGRTAVAFLQDEVPLFEVAVDWPTIPNGWALGVVASVAVDRRDHVWVLHRPGSLGPEEAGMAAPALLEFDPEGQFVQGWGGAPDSRYEWPESEHGIFVDHNDYVWVGGNGPVDQVLKFTMEGEFVMRLGTPGESQGSEDTRNFGRPADVWVHPPTNELFVADGYGNQRVIVFDADTGAFRRMWGAFGEAPRDVEPEPAWSLEQAGRGPPVFVPPVHAAKVSDDGRVYVSDRGGKRVQVFTTEGEYLDQTFIGRGCLAPACGNGTTAASTAFSSDAGQRFLYVGNRSEARVMVFERETLEYLYSFGQWGSAPGDFGTLHHMDVDSRGNLYVTEVTPLEPVNRRVQKFTFVGMGPRPSM